MIAAYMLIQDKAGQVAAAVRDVPGVEGAASVAGPAGIIARARAHDTGELGRLVLSRVRAPAACGRR